MHNYSMLEVNYSQQTPFVIWLLRCQSNPSKVNDKLHGDFSKQIWKSFKLYLFIFFHHFFMLLEYGTFFFLSFPYENGTSLNTDFISLIFMLSITFDTLYATYLDWDLHFRLFNTARWWRAVMMCTKSSSSAFLTLPPPLYSY